MGPFDGFVLYSSGHAAIQVALVWEEGWGHDKLCKLFWRVNIFSAPGMGKVSPKLVGKNKNAPALPPLINARSLTTWYFQNKTTEIFLSKA